MDKQEATKIIKEAIQGYIEDCISEDVELQHQINKAFKILKGARGFDNEDNTVMENFSDWILDRPVGVDCQFMEICSGVVYGTENEICFSIQFQMPFDDSKPRKGPFITKIKEKGKYE